MYEGLGKKSILVWQSGRRSENHQICLTWLKDAAHLETFYIEGLGYWLSRCFNLQDVGDQPPQGGAGPGAVNPPLDNEHVNND